MGAHLSGHLGVGDVTDEGVREGVLVLVGHRGFAHAPDQSPADQFTQHDVHGVALAVSERRNGTVPEDLAHHGGVGKDGLLLARECIEARRHHGLHGGRHLDFTGTVDKQARRLLGEERVAFGARDDIGDPLAERFRVAQEAGDQPLRILRSQRAKGDAVHLCAAGG